LWIIVVLLYTLELKQEAILIFKDRRSFNFGWDKLTPKLLKRAAVFFVGVTYKNGLSVACVTRGFSHGI
jgi:hypothetical protein